MNSWAIYFGGLSVVLAAALCAWVWSLERGNVAIVDSLWPLLFAILAFTFAAAAPRMDARGVLVLVLVSVWAVRLSLYITWRNWGQGEDRRYKAIRARNEPNFAVKSVYLVFGLQACLAWFVALPLFGALMNDGALHIADFAGAALWLVGFVFEAVGDFQLARFMADPANDGRVMDRGFWRLTRHPNYFGDFCVWWGLYVIAAAAGAWWSFPGPLVMSLLLLRVSGVALLEQDIGERRPQYADYVRRTNAFFPGKPKN